MQNIIIFDGMCNLCAYSVQFILKYESSPKLYFASVQSLAGSRLMREHGFDPTDAKTFVLIEDHKIFLRSEAAIRLTCHLRMPWRALGMLRVVPSWLLDWGYDLIARNRYRWFGRRDLCIVPNAVDANRFLN